VRVNKVPEVKIRRSLGETVFLRDFFKRRLAGTQQTSFRLKNTAGHTSSKTGCTLNISSCAILGEIDVVFYHHAAICQGRQLPFILLLNTRE
jgi:hypothetical protein